MDKQIDRLDKKYPGDHPFAYRPRGRSGGGGLLWLTARQSGSDGTNRQAGAYLGLRPRQNSLATPTRSAASPKTGNTLPAQSYWCSRHSNILGRMATDSELRRWGLKAGCPAVANGARKRRRRCRGPQAGRDLLSMWRKPQKVLNRFLSPATQ